MKESLPKPKVDQVDHAPHSAWITLKTALVLQQYDGKVFRVLMVIAGTFLGLLLGLFLLGMLSRRANTPGAMIGFVAGAVCVGLAMRLQVGGLWFGAVACVPTAVVGMLASYLFPPPADE